MMYKIKTTLTVFSFFCILSLHAQDGYFVKTAGQVTTGDSEEQLFVTENFPYYSICDWKAGQKFMVYTEDKYSFIPILKSSANDREISNAKLQHSILEFQGVKEVERKTFSGDAITTQFMFDAEGEKYYYEAKNQQLGEICTANPRALIYNLVYLGDVDIARELLIDKTLYTKVTTARVDDENSSNGYREVSIPRNLQVNVTAVGVGTRECPVKIVFEDKDGNSYYRNVMFSRTNSGLIESDVVGANLEKYFPNVFSFSDKDVKTNKDIRDKYVGRAIYPKRTIEVTKPGGYLYTLLRYTPLVVRELTPSGSSTMATLRLTDAKGGVYTVEVDLRYDIYLRNENYIDDMFGYGDLRKQYPSISEDTWALLGKAEIKTGMTKTECKLSLGEPVQIVKKTNSRYEAWYYRNRTLQFEEDRLLRIE